MKKSADRTQAFTALDLWVKIVIVTLLSTMLMGAAALFSMHVALLMALARISRDESQELAKLFDKVDSLKDLERETSLRSRF